MINTSLAMHLNIKIPYSHLSSKEFLWYSCQKTINFNLYYNAFEINHGWPYVRSLFLMSYSKEFFCFYPQNIAQLRFDLWYLVLQ